MFNLHIFTTLLLVVTFAEKDYDGTYNYCFDSARNTSQKEYTISYTSKKPLKLIEGQKFNADLELWCDYGPTLDEAMSDKLNQWISYNKYICNVVQIEFLEDK